MCKSRGKKTSLRLNGNASAFEVKRKYVSFKTQGRFVSNASAFGLKRTCVFWGFLKGHKKSLPIVTMERLFFIFPEK